ncbi:anhydro-N-acetylmuramic acid kinase [Paracoccus sp. p4-l81]|uniref:anhydro-N-acetylmuramic acid kinase n=1 Tax=Paracoccus sp. p4-l81 TaxID=3342806 RepID=UPI0035B70631
MAKGKAMDWVAGCMSGTSLDGVDVALIQTDGVAIGGFGRSAYRAFSGHERDILRAALGRWPGEAGVSGAARVVEDAHLALLADFPEAALIGFHGQTLAHDPGGRGTHQAGDGARLARALNRPVAWDFRSADVAAGGQGAPLVPFFHHALARHLGAGAPVVFLNLGGVGNLTWADPRIDDPAAPGACLAFDTGPANAPINDLMMARRGLDCDTGGALAAQGVADAVRVADFLTHPFFAAPAPKSLDRDSFAQALRVDDLVDADACATLTAAAAQVVAAGLDLLPERPERIHVCGGGRLNATLMAMLAAACACPVQPVEHMGLDGNLIEAQAFAYLAARVARGLPLTAPGTTGVARPLVGGRITRL